MKKIHCFLIQGSLFLVFCSSKISECKYMYTYCNIGICLECDDGFYNANCTALCGLCANDQHCDKRTGACINGCKQNFKLPLCQGNLLWILQRFIKWGWWSCPFFNIIVISLNYILTFQINIKIKLLAIKPHPWYLYTKTKIYMW